MKPRSVVRFGWILPLVGLVSCGGISGALGLGRQEPVDRSTIPWTDLDEVCVGLDKVTGEDRISGGESFYFYQNGYPMAGRASADGGRSVQRLLPSTTDNDPRYRQALWAVYLDSGISGATVSLGPDKFIDLAGWVADGYLGFWVKADFAPKRFWISLIDLQIDGNSFESRIEGTRYDSQHFGGWFLMAIPLARFPDSGIHRDPQSGEEVRGKMDWSRIKSFRISSEPEGNPPGKVPPYRFLLDQIGCFEKKPVQLNFSRRRR
ncbi:MAG: hypothetical protein H6686_11430 [Fibrobacteria bacterium]|nr:hypothetical protein [Fibrobacteria bacterium]